MADGDTILPNKVVCAYYDDMGNEFRRTIPAFYHAQAGLGWVHPTSGDTRVCPKGLKPRTVLARDTANPTRRRRIVVATQAAYAAITDATTFTVNWGNVEDTFTVYAKEGERLRGVVLDEA